jgi:Zn-dependent M28 family amino/carboxypeptidase
VTHAPPPAAIATPHDEAFLGTTASMGVPESALIVLGALEHLSLERDRDRMQATMLRMLADLCGAEEITLHCRASERMLPMLVAAKHREPQPVDPEGPWPVAEETLAAAVAALSATPG